MSFLTTTERQQKKKKSKKDEELLLLVGVKTEKAYVVELENATGKEIKGIESNSKKIEKGFLFVAIKGFDVDGHTFINSAIENGAVAVAVDASSDLKSLNILANSVGSAGMISGQCFDINLFLAD